MSFHFIPSLAGPSTTNQRPCLLPPSQPTTHTLADTGHQTAWRSGGPFSSDPTSGTYREPILVRPMALTWASLSFPNTNSSSPTQWPIRSAHMCLARLCQLILSLYQRGISNNPLPSHHSLGAAVPFHTCLPVQILPLTLMLSFYMKSLTFPTAHSTPAHAHIPIFHMHTLGLVSIAILYVSKKGTKLTGTQISQIPDYAKFPNCHSSINPTSLWKELPKCSNLTPKF